MFLVSKMAADLELVLPSMKSLNSCVTTEGDSCSCFLNQIAGLDMTVLVMIRFFGLWKWGERSGFQGSMGT